MSSTSASVIYVHLCHFQVRQMEIGALVTIRGIGRVNLANLTQVSMQIIFLCLLFILYYILHMDNSYLDGFMRSTHLSY